MLINRFFFAFSPTDNEYAVCALILYDCVAQDRIGQEKKREKTTYAALYIYTPQCMSHRCTLWLSADSFLLV